MYLNTEATTFQYLELVFQKIATDSCAVSNRWFLKCSVSILGVNIPVSSVQDCKPTVNVKKRWREEANQQTCRVISECCLCYT